jgi:hypothetical protein
MVAGLCSQRPCVRDQTAWERAAAPSATACPCSRGYLGRLSPYGQGGPSSDRHTKVVLGPCHYRAIHSGHDRSRADNHGQRHGALDLRRSPNFAGDDLPNLALGAGGQSAVLSKTKQASAASTGQLDRRSDEPDRPIAETGCPGSVVSKERRHNRLLHIAWRADRIERKQ